MSDMNRKARIEDVHDLAAGMPYVTVDYGAGGNPVYQVGRKSFVFFRNPRPDAIDPETDERYRDIIVFWVPSEADKEALVHDETSPFFTTGHFKGHPCCVGVPPEPPSGSSSVRMMRVLTLDADFALSTKCGRR